MSVVDNLREQYGDVYVTETSDGIIIPWRPLSLGEYFEYQTKMDAGLIAPSVLEDEIFKKCVTDRVLADEMGRLKAGTVTTVVATIMQHSGPANNDDLQQVLNFSRHRANQIIHKMVTIICGAFPAYKPDDLYKLDFEVFMLRLAQAEDRLLGVQLTGPLTFGTQEEEVQAPPGPQIPERKKPKVDLGKLAEEYAKQNEQPTQAQFRAAPKKPAPGEKTVITGSDINEHQVAVGIMDDVSKQGMKATDDLYKRYLDHKDESGKVAIPSHEERVAVAKKRAELNEKIHAQHVQRYELAQDKAKEEAERIRAERAAKKRKLKKR